MNTVPIHYVREWKARLVVRRKRKHTRPVILRIFMLGPGEPHSFFYVAPNHGLDADGAYVLPKSF